MPTDSNLRVTCPKCGKQLKVKPTSSGKRVRCPDKSCATLILVPDNAEEDANLPHCYFCDQRPANGDNLRCEMYGNVKYLDVDLGSGKVKKEMLVTFEKVALEFPRCKTCVAIQASLEDALFQGCLMSFLISVAIGIAGWIATYFILPAGLKDRGMFASLGGLGSLVFAFLLATIWGKLRLRNHFERHGVKPPPPLHCRWEQLPEIAARIEEGWLIGKQPARAGESMNDTQMRVLSDRIVNIRPK